MKSNLKNMNLVLKCCWGSLAVNNVLIQPSRCFYKTPTVLAALYSPHGKMLKFQGMTRKPVAQYFDAFLIIDFEATCSPGYKKDKVQEIIEFPCLWVETKTFQIIGQFHRYVRPIVTTSLGEFCTSLTGISEYMLLDCDHFPYVLDDFVRWYNEMKSKTRSEKEIFITCGTWDLEYMLPKQCKDLDIPVPEFMTRFIDIKETFGKVTGMYPKTLTEMIILLNEKRLGKMHRGIDDCRNIHTVVKRFGVNGYNFI